MTASAVSVDDCDNLRIRTNGSIACWGYDGFGQTSPPGGTFTAVSAGYIHSCAITTSGKASRRGSNFDGMSSPPAGTLQRRQRWCPSHTCAITTSSRVCFGFNNAVNRSPPVGRVLSAVGAGTWAHSCATSGAPGTVACFGDERHRPGKSAAEPSWPSDRATPAELYDSYLWHQDERHRWRAGVTLDRDRNSVHRAFIDISTSGRHICGIRTNGYLACFGENGDGQALASERHLLALSAAPFSCGFARTGPLLLGFDTNGEPMLHPAPSRPCCGRRPGLQLRHRHPRRPPLLGAHRRSRTTATFGYVPLVQPG